MSYRLGGGQIWVGVDEQTGPCMGLCMGWCLGGIKNCAQNSSTGCLATLTALSKNHYSPVPNKEDLLWDHRGSFTHYLSKYISTKTPASKNLWKFKSEFLTYYLEPKCKHKVVAVDQIIVIKA